MVYWRKISLLQFLFRSVGTATVMHGGTEHWLRKMEQLSVSLTIVDSVISADPNNDLCKRYMLADFTAFSNQSNSVYYSKLKQNYEYSCRLCVLLREIYFYSATSTHPDFFTTEVLANWEFWATEQLHMWNSWEAFCQATKFQWPSSFPSTQTNIVLPAIPSSERPSLPTGTEIILHDYEKHGASPIPKEQT